MLRALAGGEQLRVRLEPLFDDCPSWVLAVTLTRLVDRGLIERRRGEFNQRLAVYALTERGAVAVRILSRQNERPEPVAAPVGD